MAKFRCLAGSALLAALAGCASKPPSPPADVRPTATRLSQPAVSAADFVGTNASIELFVIRSSELALQRSASPRVHDFARRMIDAHKGTSAQLSLAGRRLNLLPSAALRPAHEAVLEALGNSANFDADYVREQRRVHQAAVELDSGYAQRGESPTLRPVAAAALPIERRHLRLLAYL